MGKNPHYFKKVLTELLKYAIINSTSQEKGIDKNEDYYVCNKTRNP